MGVLYNAPRVFTLEDFSLGWDLSDPMTLDKRCLADCRNMTLIQTKGMEKRGGLDKFAATPAISGAAVKDIFEYEAPDGNQYLLVAGGTKLVSYLNGNWSDAKTGLTSGKRFRFTVHAGFCYCANGADANFKLYNSEVSAVGIVPPPAAPACSNDTVEVDGWTGTYVYGYCYRRSTHRTLTSNPSALTEHAVQDMPLGRGLQVKVDYAASTDPQVDQIVIVRSKNLNEGGLTDELYEVATLTNETGAFLDATLDEALGAQVELDNTVPPKAKFVLNYMDKVFYFNCPDETDGKSLMMHSKPGLGEAVPSTNYEYFGRGDGQEITGAAVVPSGLVVFKRNKLFKLVVEADGTFSQKKEVALGIGCIAPYAILQFEDRVLFLAEEGWYAYDGDGLYPLSRRINQLVRERYVSYKEAENYSAVFYPEREHFQFLMNHSTLTPRVLVGHFITPLIFFDQGIAEMEAASSIVAWTYHEYPHHTLTCLAPYTDADGMTKILAGGNDGYVYKLDYGVADETYDIPFLARSGWFTLGAMATYVQTMRLCFLSYTTSITDEFELELQADFLPAFLKKKLYGTDAAYCGSSYCAYVYCGLSGDTVDRIPTNGVGSWFRYQIGGESKQALSVHALLFQSRIQGVR